MLWWVRVAPLGLPVVPEVNWMLMGSSNCSSLWRQLVEHFPVVGGFEAVCGHQGGDAGQMPTRSPRLTPMAMPSSGLLAVSTLGIMPSFSCQFDHRQLPPNACPTLEPLWRFSWLLIQSPVTTSLFRSTPVLMPRPFSRYSTSSVATLPEAPLA